MRPYASLNVTKPSWAERTIVNPFSTPRVTAMRDSIVALSVGFPRRLKYDRGVGADVQGGREAEGLRN